MSYTSITCPHCRAEKIAARITSGAQLPDVDGERRYFFVAVCRKCGFPAIIIARRTGTRLSDGPPLIKHVCRTERDPIPNYIEQIDMIPAPGGVTAPDGLPENVASAFAEAMDSLQRGAVNSAAMGLRLTLERATQALRGDREKPLVERIAALVRSQALPPALSKWANEALLVSGTRDNSETDPTQGELKNARRFTEMFLTCAFTLPSRIEERRGLGPGPEQPAAPMSEVPAAASGVARPR